MQSNSKSFGGLGSLALLICIATPANAEPHKQCVEKDVACVAAMAPADQDDDCDMAIDELGMPIDKKKKKSGGIIYHSPNPQTLKNGDPKVSASQSGQTLRHAINTKGTGATGRTEAACHAINTKGTGAAGRAGSPVQKQDQAHDVHELEKISFAVLAEAKDAPLNTSYLRVATSADYDGDGIRDEAIVRLVCAAGVVREAAIMPLATTDSTGKRTHHPVTFVKEWGPSTPQFRSLTNGYLKRKLEKLSARSSGGWVSMQLDGNTGLCQR